MVRAHHAPSCFYPYVMHMINFTSLPPFSACSQGLYIILQMDWKHYIITLVKILQLSLRPEVYPEMSDSTATYYT